MTDKDAEIAMWKEHCQQHIEERDRARQLAYDLAECLKGHVKVIPDRRAQELLAIVDLSRGIGTYEFPSEKISI